MKNGKRQPSKTCVNPIPMSVVMSATPEAEIYKHLKNLNEPLHDKDWAWINLYHKRHGSTDSPITPTS